MPQVDVEVDVEQRIRLIALDADLADKITEIARARHTSSEALVDTWLRERVAEAAAILRELGTQYHQE